MVIRRTKGFRSVTDVLDLRTTETRNMTSTVRKAEGNGIYWRSENSREEEMYCIVTRRAWMQWRLPLLGFAEDRALRNIQFELAVRRTIGQTSAYTPSKVVLSRLRLIPPNTGLGGKLHCGLG